jgi:hypothetical protein
MDLEVFERLWAKRLQGGVQKAKRRESALSEPPSPAPVTHDSPDSPVLLQNRPDWLSVGIRCTFTPQVLDAVKAALDAAWRYGETELRVGDYVFAAKRSERRGTVQFGNQDIRGMIDLKELPADDEGGRPVGWTIAIDVAATLLARHTFAAVIAMLDDIASAFGAVEQMVVRRLDLAVDFKHWAIHRDDAENFKRPSGPSKVNEWVEMTDPTRARYHAGAKLTGVTICPGGVIMCRIYDKTQELKIRRNEEKTATEHEVWTWAGWREGDDVTRIEFQLRSEALKEFEGFDARNPHELANNLDQIWRYCVEKWCALLIPDSERVSRRTVDPRWLAVQAVVFQERQRLPRRQRMRVGASAGQAIGVCLSVAGAAGLVDTQFFELGIPVEAGAWSDVPKEERKPLLKRAMWLTTKQGLRAAIDEWVESRDDTLDAATQWVHRKRGVVARFAHLHASERLATCAA